MELHAYAHGDARIIREFIRWGLLYRLPVVHWLDAYDGVRPTKEGEKYFIHEEAFHLILVRKGKVDELQERSCKELASATEVAAANVGLELQMATANGFHVEMPDPKFIEQQIQVELRYMKRGFMRLDTFLECHELSTHKLIVAGVLRYLDRRGPAKDAIIVVGDKAKSMLMLSTRWQMIMVKPGMVDKLLALCQVELRP